MTFVRTSMLLAAAVTIACGDSSAPNEPESPAGPSVVTEHRVDPATTGTGITAGTGQHVVFAPAASNRSQTLFVFLPGTGGRPEFYTSILRHAAQRGHFAIGLAYTNAVAVNELCASMPSTTCQEDIRVEVITGANRSTLVNIDVANSIDNRLRALLTRLAGNFAAEGWDGFLTSSGARWDRVVVAGHSQGGGHAAMIARLRIVRRAILFAATEPAPWTNTPFTTPKSQLYGFVHRLEPQYTGITASWRLLEIVGPITTIDGLNPPFTGAHQLQTNVTSCRTVAVLDTYHNCIVTDAVTPLGTDGQPVFASVWTYLLEG